MCNYCFAPSMMQNPSSIEVLHACTFLPYFTEIFEYSTEGKPLFSGEVWGKACTGGSLMQPVGVIAVLSSFQLITRVSVCGNNENIVMFGLCSLLEITVMVSLKVCGGRAAGLVERGGSQTGQFRPRNKASLGCVFVLND